MKERELRLTTNQDKTITAMTDDDRKKHIKNISGLIDLALLLREQIKDDKLEAGFKGTMLSLLESYTVEILKDLDYDSILQKEREERYTGIRSLNIENHELRRQLGEKVTAEDVREALKNIQNNFQDFWQNVGFGFSKDYAFGGYGLRVKAHTSVLDSMIHGSDEEVLKRKAQLKDYGFTLVHDGEAEDNALGFSQENIDTLKRFLSEHFSDFDISGIESTSFRGHVYIRSVEIYLRNYDDLLNLKTGHEEGVRQ